MHFSILGPMGNAYGVDQGSDQSKRGKKYKVGDILLF